MSKRIFLIVLMGLFLLGVFSGCSQSPKPSWIDDLVNKRGQYEYFGGTLMWCQYDGTYVYYALSSCCDNMDQLYDVYGNFICSPTGGISGRGDGKCPDFDRKTCVTIIKN